MNNKQYFGVTICIVIVFLFLSNCTGNQIIDDDNPILPAQSFPLLPENKSIDEVTVFPQLGHSEGISSIAFSPDGRYIVSSSWDQSLKVWNIETARELRTFTGINSGAVTVDWSPDTIESRIISGSWDGTITIWDARTAEIIKTFPAHTGAVSSISYNNNGEQIISGGFDGSIKIWDKNGTFISGFDRYEAPINSVINAGKFIVSGYRDGCMKIWDGNTRDIIKILNSNNGAICSLSSDAKGSIIIIGYFNGAIGILDTINYNQRIILNAHNGSVNAVDMSTDGEHIVSCSFDKTVKIWDINTGSLIKTFTGHENSATTVIFNPNGEYIVSGSWDGTIRRWYRENEPGYSDHVVFATNIYYFNFAAYHPNQPLAITASTNFTNSTGLISLWDIQNGRMLKMFTAHDFPINQTAYSTDGYYILTNSFEGKIKIWDAVTTQLTAEFNSKKGEVSSAALYNNDNSVVSGLSDGTLLVWDVTSDKKTLQFKEDVSITAVQFKSDKKILTGLANGVIKLRDEKTGTELKRFEGGHSGYITAVVFSSDEKLIASCSWDTSVIIWDAETAEIVQNLKGHGDPVHSVAFSPNGERLVSASGSIFSSTGDRTIRIWDVKTGENIQTIYEHSGNVNSAAYSPDGYHILSCSYDGTTRIWNAATGTEIASFISFDDGEWIVITPDGYYNASPKGDQHLNVRIGDEVYGMDQFAKTFDRSDVVKARLQGHKDPDDIKPGVSIQTASVPPILKVTIVDDGKTTGQAVLSVTAVDWIRQISDIEIIVNGRLVGGNELQAISKANGTSIKAEGRRFPSGLTPTQTRLTTSSTDKRFEFTVPVRLDPGPNLIEIVANNDLNFGWIPVELNAPQSDTPPRGDLWVLAVGVNDYANNGPGSDTGYYDLKNPADDARKISSLFESQQGEGKRFNKVHVLCVSDNDPVKPNKQAILDRMDFLKQAGPDDTALLFMSGHGKTEEGIYYFLPHDTVFTGGDKFDPASAVNVEDLTKALDLPGRKIIMLDTCESGGIDTNRLVRTLKNRSTVVFTASQAGEFAIENTLYGGFFVYSIVEGIGGKAVREERRVPLTSLGEYISERVGELSRDRQTGAVRQHPMKYIPDGYRDFVISVVESK
ncbi:hypothetical protein AGMMS50293_26480 [Spirochaetia bacterium]|nr:hypothetical protein AGMMS50293_26480 [Spirochaetia bacterium]